MFNSNLINIFDVDKPNVCFIGDIHGEFNGLQGLMKKLQFRDTLYICVGDCGFGFEKSTYYTQIFNKLSRTASSMNCEFVFIRGNHDSKYYFDKQKINRKCFKTIPDYSVIKTPIYNILCIGGATSIDRSYRINIQETNAIKYAKYHNCSLNEAKKICKQCYWDNEQCYYDEEKLSQLKLNNINIDIVCTHTCPSFAKPIGKDNIQYWLNVDKLLDNDINNEREVMDKVFNKLKKDNHPLSFWFYGHFHYHNTEFIEGTKFVMLDMCRNGNYDIYDVHDIKREE